MSDQRPPDDVSSSTSDPQEPHPIPIEAARQQARALDRERGRFPFVKAGILFFLASKRVASPLSCRIFVRIQGAITDA